MTCAFAGHGGVLIVQGGAGIQAAIQFNGDQTFYPCSPAQSQCSDGGKDQMTWRNLAEPFCPSLVDPAPCHTAEIDLTSGSGFDMSGSQTDAELKV